LRFGQIEFGFSARCFYDFFWFGHSLSSVCR
jgi:hypothetical protein